ncbi:kinase-like domain-containing protein [Xylaria arbuscula]|nr:kinase-like domain-containing protein [Xylaria arbuscula]
MADEFVPQLLAHNLSGDDSPEPTQAFSPGHVEARLEISPSVVKEDTVSPHDSVDWDKLSEDAKILELQGARIVLYPKVKGYCINPYNGTGCFGPWLDVNKKDTTGLAKVLVVSPRHQEIGCRVIYQDAISCFFFDPAHDSVMLFNYSSGNFDVSMLGSTDMWTVKRDQTMALSVGIWDLRFDGESLLEVQVLKRQECLTRTPLCVKRSAPTDENPPKKIKVSSDRAAALIQCPPVPSIDNALIRLEKGMEIRLGSWPNRYWLTHLGTIFENNQTAVWRAKHSSMKEKDIVVKVTKASRGNRMFTISVAKRWMRECQIHTSFDHPHIVRFLGMDARFHCLYLEHIDGRALSARVNSPSAIFTGTHEDALRIIGDLASAIGHVHSKDTVHGDIKPGNVLYNHTRGAVLIDFGLSFRVTNPAASNGCGTPWYLPPEFMQDGRLHGPEADIWAFGITMLWLLKYIALPELTRKEWNIGHINPNGTAPKSFSEAMQAMITWTKFVENTREVFLLPGYTDLDRLVARALDPNRETRIDAASLCEQLQGLRLEAQPDDNTAPQNQAMDAGVFGDELNIQNWLKEFPFEDGYNFDDCLRNSESIDDSGPGNVDGDSEEVSQ